MKDRAQRMDLLSQTLEKQQIKNLIVNDKGQQHLITFGFLDRDRGPSGLLHPVLRRPATRRKQKSQTF
ncbi:MAG: hypothetical protein IPP17_24640 [Bacteroidetes bacterium]|nr:hypothetical protein [Bacteroidota bacterium]